MCCTRLAEIQDAKIRLLRSIAHCDGAQKANFCVLYFQRAACSTFQTWIKYAWLVKRVYLAIETAGTWYHQAVEQVHQLGDWRAT